MNWIVKSLVAMNKSNTRQINLLPTEVVNPLEKPNSQVEQDESTAEWKHINWRKLEKRVFK